ncbi:MAG: TonB-dependent receptor [Blastocatellales bacterium]|nr:TonB-dependent receptor [Blastocatellales bacterium]
MEKRERLHLLGVGCRMMLACVLMLCFGASAAHAQFDSATVLGTIRDANGAALPGATVTIRSIATGISTSVQSDGNGDFLFSNVRIGSYRISVELAGFSTAVADNVVVTVNARQRVDLTMQPGAVTESIVITDAVQLLETDSSVRGQVIQREQIVNLPLNGRSYANLALLTPGVRESSQNSATGAGREAAFNVNGLRNTVNNFLLDGVDNNAYGTSNQGFSAQVVQVSPDAVQEFKVQTNTYSAEFGRSGGAVINAAYRSGTNQFHGSLWEFHRNTALNAVGFFKPATGEKPPLIRNQFGFTFGGPIIRDRTFFFLDYEGFRQVQKNVVFSTLPTLQQRQGILSVAVRDPLTGTTYAAGTPIPMTDFARKVLNELPAPNVPGATNNNYRELRPDRNFNDKFNIRLDHKLNDKLNLFTRISHRKVNEFNGPNIPGPSGSNQNGFINVLNQQLVGGATYIFSNASALEVRLGISRTEAGKRPPLAGGPSMRQLYGITGLPEDPLVTGGLTTQTINGFSQLGRQATNPQFQNPFNVNPRVNYTFALGRHSLKTGYEYLAVNTDVQDTNPLMGLDTYAGQFSRPAGAAANAQLYNIADFMFGARSQYEFADLLVVESRRRLHYTYLQDDFKVNQKLTLNLGVRYEYATPYYENRNRQSNFDPVTRSIIQAKNGSIYDRSLVDPDYNNFAPRIGFAWNVLDKTVVRGGYGIGYVHFNRIGSADVLATNFPQITRANVTQTAGVPRCTGTVFAEGCFRPTQDGYPTNLPNNVVLFIPREIRTPYIQNWQLSIQRELTSNMLIDIAYVGNHAVKMIMLADYNQARTLTEAEFALPAAQRPTLDERRPIQGFRSISAVLPAAYSNYHALQVKFERRFSRGLYALNSFTWSKAIDNASQVLEEPGGNTGTPQNVYNIAADRGLGAYDQPFNNTTSVVWELPVGRGRAFGGDVHKAVDAVIGGWMVSAINTMASGQTINFRYTPAPVTANLPSFIGGVALRPNLVGNPILPKSERTIDRYFNTEAIRLPGVTAPFGNAGRNIGRSPSFYQLDMGLQKSFPLPINEVSRVEFKAEFFNILNKTNFGNPSGSANGIVFNAAGQLTNPGTFGQIRSTAPARQIQFALKVAF